MSDMKKQLLENLHAGVCRVKFTKANGDVRDMLCTLNEEWLPPKDPDAKDKPARKENPEAQAVWDIEKEAWRSFRWDSIVDEDTDPI